MGLGSFFKGIGRGIGRAVSRPVRGIGRMMRGKFREGLGDIGHGIKRGAQVAALLGTGGAAGVPMWAAAAGGGMLERGMDRNASVGNVLGAGVSGASGAMAARSVGNIGRSMLNRGVTQTVGQTASAGGMPRRTHEALRLGDTLREGGVTTYGGNAALSAAKEAPGRFTGIGTALRSGANFLEEHPKSVEFAGNLLSGRADAQIREDRQQYYLDVLAQRREEEEYERSREKMLRDLIISGGWRSR